MAMNITPVTNHRERERGLLVYPVRSRRSEGLSIGINLFPDKKKCDFDCPYCEVFPFSTNAEFSLLQMENDLLAAIDSANENHEIIKDICFSGNGEPTLSPFFTQAFKSAQAIREKASSCAKIVVITNGTGFFNQDIFSLLKEASAGTCVDIWLKLDAGTPYWYQQMNRSALPYQKLIEKIKEFTSDAKVTIQTMLCSVNGNVPPKTEKKEWNKLVSMLAANSSCGIRLVQLYGKARPAPEDPLASKLPAVYIADRASSLRRRLANKDLNVPVQIFL